MCVFVVPKGTPAPTNGFLLTAPLFQAVGETLDQNARLLVEQVRYCEEKTEAQEQHFTAKLDLMQALQKKQNDTSLKALQAEKERADQLAAEQAGNTVLASLASAGVGLLVGGALVAVGVGFLLFSPQP